MAAAPASGVNATRGVEDAGIVSHPRKIDAETTAHLARHPNRLNRHLNNHRPQRQ